MIPRSRDCWSTLGAAAAGVVVLMVIGCSSATPAINSSSTIYPTVSRTHESSQSPGAPTTAVATPAPPATPSPTQASGSSFTTKDTAPTIPGLHTRTGKALVTYYADASNPYGLKADAVAGTFNSNVEMQLADSSEIRTGGAVLDGAVIEVLMSQQADLRIPIAVDAENTSVQISFDNNGFDGDETSAWNVSRVYVTFGGTCKITNPFPQEYNTVYALVANPSAGKIKWIFYNHEYTKSVRSNLSGTGPAAIEALYTYGQDAPLNPYRGQNLGHSAPLGAELGKTTRSISMSLGNGVKGQDDLLMTPDLVLAAGGVPVFIEAGPSVY